MKQKPYWQLRGKESLAESFKTAAAAERYIEALYKETLLSFCQKYNELLEPFVKDGVLDTAALNAARNYDMNFNAKLQRLDAEIASFTELLNEKQQAAILTTLKKIYKDSVISTLSSFGKEPKNTYLLNEAFITNAVKMPWCADGREFSPRIWSNLQKMNRNLRATLSEAIAKGESIQNTTRKFRDIMGNTTYNTHRIIRTETAAIHTRASLDTYKELGVQEIEILTEAGACDTCSDAALNPIKIEESEIGVNITPLHPNCKCCVIPIIKNF